jgi:hypothetical protein
MHSFFLHKCLSKTLIQALGWFPSAFLQQGMKFAFKIKTEPVTQAAIIIGVIAFASGFLATIAIYINTPLTGIICAVVLAIILYLTLQTCSLLIIASCNFTMEPVHPTGAPLGGQLALAPTLVTPLVLQILPLPGLSDQEEFFYNLLPDVHHGAFAATRTFFIEHSHQVVVHNCADIATFQAMQPFGTTLWPLDNLPPCVFTKGYVRLQEMAIAAAMANPDKAAVPPAAVAGNKPRVFPTSLIHCDANIP